jgi:predicted amidophosphoribosyltransferase
LSNKLEGREVAIKCSKCQSDNPDTQRFCGECGTQLLPSEEISASPKETIQAPINELTRGSTFAGRYEIIEAILIFLISYLFMLPASRIM